MSLLQLFADDIKKYRKVYTVITGVIIVYFSLSIGEKYLKGKFSQYESEKNQLIELVKNQTEEIKKEHQDTLAKLQEIDVLKSQIGTIAQQNRDIKNKLVKYQNEHPVQEIAKNEKTETIVNDINAWYNSGKDSPTFESNSRVSIPDSQLQGFYYDAKNWRINGPILKTSLDDSLELNKSYETKIQLDDNLINKQSKLIDDQQKTFDVQENRFKNQVKITDDTQKEVSNLSKQVKIEKTQKWIAIAAFVAKLFIK